MVAFRYRGRDLSSADILYIRELITAHPQASRRSLSRLLCEAWAWRQPNGALRDMVCRSMLLLLDRAGQITLPPVSYVRHNPLASRQKPAPVLINRSPIEMPLRKLRPLEFMQVRLTVASKNGATMAGRKGPATLLRGGQPPAGRCHR